MQNTSRETYRIGIITAVAGSAKSIAAKWKIAELLDIQILGTHQPLPLDEDIDRELDRIKKKAADSLA